MELLKLPNLSIIDSNVKNFIGLMNNLIDKSNEVPKMGLVYGDPGLGKTQTAVWWATRNDAVYVRAQNTIMSASMMMSQEIDKLEAKFDDETKIFTEYSMNQSCHWRECNEQLIKCRVIKAQIELLHKMIDQLSAMNIELPQLTSV